MQPVSADIWEQYSAVLMKREISVSCHADYRKWLRYYLDFRSKYSPPDSMSEHVRLFIQKLREKKQSPEQQKQAAHALSLYFEMLRKTNKETHSAQINTEKTEKAIFRSPIKTPGDKFIKGESSSNLSRADAAPQSASQPSDSGDIGQVSVPATSTGRRFNDWRCLK